MWSEGPDIHPLELGHEPVGTVVATGPGVDMPIGTWITGRIEPSYRQYAVANVADVVEVPDGLDPQVALGEPVGWVAEGLRRVPVHLADRVAIVGLGFMGLVMVELLANSATASVVAIDIRDDARAAALRCGADVSCHPRELPADHFVGTDEGSTGRCGFYVVVEATGTQSGLDLATALVRPHGVISILGYHQTQRSVDLGTWNWKAIDVVHARPRSGSVV